MLRALLGFGRRTGRQHQALPPLERVQRGLQGVQRHAAGLGVMVRLGRGQQLGEFEEAIDHRRVVALEIVGRGVRVVTDAGDQAARLQPRSGSWPPAPATGRPAPKLSLAGNRAGEPGALTRTHRSPAASRRPSARPSCRIHAAAVIDRSPFRSQVTTMERCGDERKPKNVTGLGVFEVGFRGMGRWVACGRRLLS